MILLQDIWVYEPAQPMDVYPINIWLVFHSWTQLDMPANQSCCFIDKGQRKRYLRIISPKPRESYGATRTNQSTASESDKFAALEFQITSVFFPSLKNPDLLEEDSDAPG